jgi:2',3'-cyclic-nucleotide 2'-phosphodiesterase (5'-nucleotidase family)
MRYLVRIARSAGLAGLLALIGAAPALAATQTLTILHDNDIHGHLRPFCSIEVGTGPDPQPEGPNARAGAVD